MNPSRVDSVVDLMYGLLIGASVVLIMVAGNAVGLAFGFGVLISFVIHVVWKMARFDPDWMTTEVQRTVEETVDETVSETVEKTVGETVEKTVDETVEETVSETVEQKVGETVEKTVEKTVDETVDETVEETVGKTVERTVEETLGEQMNAKSGAWEDENEAEVWDDEADDTDGKAATDGGGDADDRAVDS
ncbi:MAG: hypothetical protein ABEJ05_01235 [Haloglomus sp.]